MNITRKFCGFYGSMIKMIELNVSFLNNIFFKTYILNLKSKEKIFCCLIQNNNK